MSNRTCHLEGRWASGLLQEDQQLSVLSRLLSLLKMKMSWRQKEMSVTSFNLLVFPTSSFVSKTLSWQASRSQRQLFLHVQEPAQRVALWVSRVCLMWEGGEQGKAAEDTWGRAHPVAPLD